MNRRRLLWLVCLIAFTGTTAKAQDARDTVRFLRHSWATVSREGPKAIDNARLQWPKEIRRIDERVREFSCRWLKEGDPKSLEERARLMAELWRIRGSINLLGLLSPANLKAVTGLEVDEFLKIATQVRHWR